MLNARELYFEPNARCSSPQRDICCFLKVQLHFPTKLPDEKNWFDQFFFTKFHFFCAGSQVTEEPDMSTSRYSSNFRTAKRNTQISANLLENFRRAGRVCLWVLIIYEAKRCLFCLTILGLVSFSVRRGASSWLLSAWKKLPKFKFCAQICPVKFQNISSAPTFFETRVQGVLKVGDVFDRFFDDFDLKRTRKNRFHILECLGNSGACFIAIPYLRNTRPWCCRWNQGS